jgi:hypothetical protein
MRNTQNSGRPDPRGAIAQRARGRRHLRKATTLVIGGAVLVSVIGTSLASQVSTHHTAKTTAVSSNGTVAGSAAAVAAAQQAASTGLSASNSTRSASTSSPTASQSQPVASSGGS